MTIKGKTQYEKLPPVFAKKGKLLPSKFIRRGRVYSVNIAATEGKFLSLLLFFEPNSELVTVHNDNFNVHYQEFIDSNDCEHKHYLRGKYHNIVNSSLKNWLIVIASIRYC